MAEAPPPAYEDVVGPYAGASAFLCFQDFWPRCINQELKAKYGAFQNFRFVQSVEI